MMEKWNYESYPAHECDHVFRLITEVRRIRQENRINKETEIQLFAVDNCPLTDGGRELLKKLANAVIVKDELDGSRVSIFVKN